MEVNAELLEDLDEQINQVESELEEMVGAKRRLPRLTLDDHESVSDNYQSHLELNGEISALQEHRNNLVARREKLIQSND